MILSVGVRSSENQTFKTAFKYDKFGTWLDSQHKWWVQERVSIDKFVGGSRELLHLPGDNTTKIGKTGTTKKEIVQTRLPLLKLFGLRQ